MHKLVYIFFFLAIVVKAQTRMTQTEAAALKTLVKTQATTTKTISSDFVQYKHMDFLSNDIVTKGTLKFKIPNLVRWEYTNPFSYSLIFKNESLYINDEGKKSAMDMGSSKLFKQLNSLIIKSIKGDMFDDNEFTIEYYKQDANSLVYFFPKNNKSSKYIEAFHITFNSKGDVETVKMMEPSGDYTKIEFSNRVLNSPIGDAVFNH